MFDFIRKNMKVADVILAVSVAGIALAIFLFNIASGMNTDTITVCVYQDGKAVDSFQVDSTFSLEKTYTSTWGSNSLIISERQVYISESSCPDHLCRLMGRISKPGQTITCLPNRLQVAIEGEKYDTDAINY